MAQSCNVVLVLRSLGSGGVEVHACQLAAGLINRGMEVTIVSLCVGEVNSNFLRLGVNIIQLSDTQGQGIGSFKNIFVLRRKLQLLQPDVVHLHGIRPIFIGSIAARLALVPTIISTMHGSYRLMAMDKYGNSSRFKLGVSILMHSIGILLSTHFITVARILEAEAGHCLNKTVGQWLGRRCNQNILVIRNSIDDKFFNVPKIVKFDTPIPTIGVVARLDPKKGIRFLLEAVRDLNSTGTPCRLLIVGDGPSISEYKNFVNTSYLIDKINFLGHQENVIPFLQEMEVFVLPSLSEGMPLVILEAMAVGVPVVATAVGGIPEIVENGITGLLVPSGSSIALTEALRRLLTDPNLRSELKVSSLKFVAANHREKNMIDAVLSLYRCSR